MATISSVPVAVNSKLFIEAAFSLAINSRLAIGNNQVVLEQNILTLVEIALTVSSGLPNTVNVTTGWEDYALLVNSALQETIELSPLVIRVDLLSTQIVQTSLRISSSLTSSGVATSREVNTTYRIYFDNEDVTSKIANCSVVYSKDSFCGQVDITWKDWSLFPQLDPMLLNVNFKRERFSVYVNNVLLGRFLNEKRDVSVSFEETNPTSWGRTKTAFLSGPYTVPITPLIRSWDTDTTARAICEELAARENISIQWGIMDFKVRGGKMVMDSEYPIDGIIRLVSSVGGIVTTSRFSPILVVRYKWLGEVR